MKPVSLAWQIGLIGGEFVAGWAILIWLRGPCVLILAPILFPVGFTTFVPPFASQTAWLVFLISCWFMFWPACILLFDFMNRGRGRWLGLVSFSILFILLAVNFAGFVRGLDHSQLW